MEYKCFQTLKDQGILDDGEGYTEDMKKELESLSDEEMEALISIKKKLGSFTWPLQSVIKPQMF
ncbi:MAG: hypothetical protein AAF724_15465 [Pseudomonadota bacterium]